MKIKSNFKVGEVSYQIEVEEKNPLETLHLSIILSNPRKVCNRCMNTTDFEFSTNKDKEANTYINVICRACFAKSKLGSYKAGGYFWKEFEKFERFDNKESIDID